MTSLKKQSTVPMGFDYMYHVSPWSAQEAIESEGLRGHERGEHGVESPSTFGHEDWYRNMPRGNYLFPDYENAVQFGESHHKQFGVWGVDTRGLPIFPDPESQQENKTNLGIAADPFNHEENPHGLGLFQEGPYEDEPVLGGSPPRYVVPAHIPPERLHYVDENRERDYDAEPEEVLDTWDMLPFTERPIPGHESKTADLMGPTPYPGSTPQAEEDTKDFHPLNLDELQMTMDPVEKEYQWFYGNGELQVSPLHDHEQLREHAGVSSAYDGPIAAGYVTVKGKDALWSGESNIAMRGLSKVLKDYTKDVGWKWDGFLGSDGQPIHEDIGTKKSMFYRIASDGRIDISSRPLEKIILIDEKVAYVKEINDGLSEWAKDFGYRLAEVPGGGNMNDRMKNWEELNLFDKGDPDFEPENEEALEPQGPFTCDKCGEVSPDFKAYQLHSKQHEMLTEEPFEDGHFPWPGDMDDPLPARRENTKPTAMPLASVHEAGGIPSFKIYSNAWKFEGNVVYGGYLDGELQGYAIMRENVEPELLMVYSSNPGKGIGTALLEKIKLHYPNFYTHATTKEGEALLNKVGLTNVSKLRYRYAAGSEPKDLIQAPIPFIYDIDKDHIITGHPGMKTHDIMGNWPPSGIVEGYYEPGGKVTINSQTTMPYSTYHLLQLWYYQHPHMEITSLELETPEGEMRKLADTDVGSYLRTLAVTDAAAWNAYQALRKAGGKVYVVGGAVRDALLDKEPKDIDLMVGGIPPEQVEHILSGVPGGHLLGGNSENELQQTGKRFGVFRFRMNGDEVEIALPREDSYEGADRRSQGQIKVDHTLPVEQDLLRRDFTVNSMAVDLDNGKLVDPYGGSQDIQSHTLRTTHPSSFEEDPTRLMRALVAHSRFGLNPDERTRQEMVANAPRLDSESSDTLKPILDKLMSSNNPSGAIRLAQDTGILRHLFPEIAEHFDFDQKSKYHKYTLGEHSLHVLDNMSKKTEDPDLRLTALLHDVGKPASAWTDPEGYNHYYHNEKLGVGADHALVGAGIAERRLKERFNYPTAKTQRIYELIQHHMFPTFSSSKGARKFLNRVGDHADDLINFREADHQGKGKSTPDDIKARDDAYTMRQLVEEARTKGEATDLKGLAVNGNDLINMGIKPGKQIGDILNKLMEVVVENPQMNNPTNLTQLVQQYNGPAPQQEIPNQDVPPPE